MIGPIQGTQGLRVRTEDGIFYAWFPNGTKYNVAVGAIRDRIFEKEDIFLTDARIEFSYESVTIHIGEKYGSFAYSEFQGLF